MESQEVLLRSEAESILAALAGEDAQLREDQWVAIDALVCHRKRVLCLQRTGWGKSAVYFVATALLRRRGSGPSLIISPLLALMDAATLDAGAAHAGDLGRRPGHRHRVPAHRAARRRAGPATSVVAGFAVSIIGRF